MLVDELLLLADAYGSATGLAPSGVGRLATGNDSVFRRLRAGHTCRSDTLETAFSWFRENWPPEVPWPEGVAR